MSPENRSNSIVLLHLPAAVTYCELESGLRKRGFIIYTDPHTIENDRLYVSAMGHLDERDVDEFVAAVKGCLEDIGAACTQ